MELARLHLAAGQNLGGLGGKLDGIARRCRVGVYKLCAVNDGFAVQRISGVACLKLTYAVIGDFESDLVCTGIIPDAAEVALHLADDIGLLAYGFREIQGKRNIAFFVVLGGISGGSRNRAVCLLFAQCEREFAGLQCAVADHDIQFLGGFQSYLNAACGIGVGKLDTIRGGTIFRNGVTCHCQLAAAVVRDGNRHTVGGVVIRNTGDFSLVAGGDILGDVVHIRAGLIEGDTSEVKGGFIVGVVSTRHIPAVCIAFAIRFTLLFGQRGAIGDSLQFEAEFIVTSPSAARQNLYAAKRVIGVTRFHGNRIGVIGVCHRDFLGCTCFDLVRAVRIARGVACARIFFRDGIGAACGQAHNLGSLVFFQGESTAVFDGLGTLSAGNGVVVRGTGVQAIARQRKLHRKIGVAVRVQTRVGCNHLGNLQAACGVHGQLTVVAKVQHTLVCVKVPLEVNAAVGSVGSVARSTIFLFLIAQLVINGGGQAAFFGARLDVPFAIFWNDATLDSLISCNANGHPTGLPNRISMRRRFQLQIVQLVVVDFARFYICGLRITVITRFCVQQGILGVIVEVVAFCRGKGGRGRADGCFAVCRCIVFIKFVGVEADFAVLGGVFRNVGGKVGVGKFAGRNLLAHILFIFKADRVDDADGLGVVDFQLGGAIGVCGLIIPQGQHTGRDLDLHAVADTAAATGDGDNDVAQIGCIGVGTADRVFMLTLKDIGILRVGAGSLHLRKDLVGKGNGLKALDFHIIAQGIIESHIAFFLGLVRNLRGACRFGGYRREDVLKDLVQPVSAGSRHIVICIVGSVAEVPFILYDARFRVGSRGVVAGDRLHELVFF